MTILAEAHGKALIDRLVTKKALARVWRAEGRGVSGHFSPAFPGAVSDDSYLLHVPVWSQVRTPLPSLTPCRMALDCGL